MGGHDEPRDSQTYAAVARMARALSRKGFLMTSGGGPGAMEATHLGALLQNEPDGALGEALKKLNGQKALPADAGKVITPAGKIDDEIVRELHDWIMPAFTLSTAVKRPGESLAVPTWYYGHEPTTPCATKIGKYFQNSLREDGLITIAAHGIVFAPGKAGTLQEIFQDAVRNYYRTPPNPFSPMVFYDKTYWTRALPAARLLEELFTRNNRGPDYKKYVLVTGDEQEAIDFLIANAPPANSASPPAEKPRPAVLTIRSITIQGLPVFCRPGSTRRLAEPLSRPCRVTFRVAVTRARRRTTILTSTWRRCALP
jgi:predicted Rossmann-fold nucleotide-binding protein